MVFVPFTHGRMLVGWRARDWSKVWYEKIGSERADGSAEIGLYCLPRGEAGPREPMDGEVKWLPHYDIANCESKYKGERNRMQQQFLADAYRYLNCRDHTELTQLEEEFDKPDFSRWKSWFREAKKWKRSNAKQRRRCRRRRAERFAGMGLDVEVCAGIDSEMSSEDEDGDRGSDLGYMSESSTRHAKPSDAKSSTGRAGPSHPSRSFSAGLRNQADDEDCKQPCPTPTPDDGFFHNAAKNQKLSSSVGPGRNSMFVGSSSSTQGATSSSYARRSPTIDSNGGSLRARFPDVFGHHAGSDNKSIQGTASNRASNNGNAAILVDSDNGGEDDEEDETEDEEIEDDNNEVEPVVDD